MLEKHQITASYETLMDQATETAKFYFHTAIQVIDDEFGLDYAKKNPALLSEFMKCASEDYRQSMEMIMAQLDFEEHI